MHRSLLATLLLDTRDGDWGKGKPAPSDRPYRVIRGTDFSAARYGDLTDVPIRYLSDSSAGRRTLQAGDILIETAGGSRDRPTGRTLLITGRHLNSSRLPLTCASFCRFLRVNPELAHPAYVYWYLQYLYQSGQMWVHQVQHTGLARFQYTRFANSVAIPLPPRPAQHAIASILGSLDDKIEVNRRMNETLEEMARALFKSWFVDFDPVRAKMEDRQPTGMDEETAALFPDSFEDSPLGEIPKGWRAGSLGEIADNIRRGVDPAEVLSSTPYIGLDHMPRKSIALSEWGEAGQVASNKFEFLQGEILFGKLRPYFHKVGIAAVDGVCSTDILVIAPRLPLWYGLTLCHLSSVDLINHADATSTGTKMPRAKWSDLALFPIAIPPEEVAESFTEKVRPLVELIQANIHQSRTLAAIRDAMLPKLLSGEVRVAKAVEQVEEVL